MSSLPSLPLLLSPIHSIASRLPAQKRRPSLPTSSTPVAKRLKAADSQSSNLRHEVLVRQLLQRLPNIAVTEVRETQTGDRGGQLQDYSVEELQQDTALSLEEIQDDLLPPVEECQELEETEAADPIIEKAKDVVRSEVKKEVKKKKVEIKWRSVKRLKRKTKVFTFTESFGGKTEISTLTMKESEAVPVMLGGRRPMVMVPGIEYGLGEGEAVILCTEEEEREACLATAENYVIDSFICNSGYLSEEEMVETPAVDKVVRKVKRKGRAQDVQGKLNFSRTIVPEVSGCLWSSWAGTSGWRNPRAMKKWQALVLVTAPIHTTFTSPVTVQEEILIPPREVDPPSHPETESGKLMDWVSHYSVKYLVKQAVEKAVVGPGPSLSSTAMVTGTGNISPAGLVNQVISDGGKQLQGKEELVQRFVCKYFYKLKYCNNI